MSNIQLTVVDQSESMASFLYMMLAQRRPEANISHRSMPTWQEHRNFIRSNPYKHWWLVCVEAVEIVNPDMPWIGNVYVTRQNEVGIFVLDQFQHQGYGGKIMDMVESDFDELLANIAPGNQASTEFFTGRGYNLIQQTYRWTKHKT